MPDSILPPEIDAALRQFLAIGGTGQLLVHISEGTIVRGQFNNVAIPKPKAVAASR